MKKQIYIFDGISLTPDAPENEAISKVLSKLLKSGVPRSACELNIYKKSVDARHKNDIRIIYSVSARVDGESNKYIKAFSKLGAREVVEGELEIKRGDKKMSQRPLVVGMGPAGLFCALILAEQGYRPIIIDRGDSIKDRVSSVERFYREHILDTESNIQFGAGGAGTFSDGKLLTRINDPKCAYVLDALRRFGAPEEITIKAKPHIGTDILRLVVDNILKHIQDCGGEVIYRCKLIDVLNRDDGLVLAKTNKGDFLCSCAVLALGHSARDTYEMLISNNFSVAPKPISVGVRIEHRRSFIEEALYGRFAGTKSLGAAEYALSDTKGERGVYTFCMCPGGEVVAAASEEGSVVVNGMSSYARDGINSNSAIAVSLRVEDYQSKNGSLALGAIELQRQIEKRAFLAGGGDYAVPIQTVGDFMREKVGSEPSEVMPTYMGGNHYKLASMDEILPSFVTKSLRYGLDCFDKKIHGFMSDVALLSGAETRTSSPIRILRGEDRRALGKGNIYPCGEGAGYAGGITSAAVDGIKTALSIISEYLPFE